MRALLSCFFIIPWKVDLENVSLVLSKVLGEFINTLTFDGKYPVQDFEKLHLPIQMQLSGKRKNFSGFLVPFLESTSNFKHFEKKDDCHS